jgi:hypothetical protein
LSIVGVASGVLSGLFGVGGGFIIVPALVLFSGMPVHRAVGTSLMVIALVSVSGIASLIGAGRAISPVTTGLFVLGGISGLFAGEQIGRRLSGPLLQRVFAVAMFAVAAFIVVNSIP